MPTKPELEAQLSKYKTLHRDMLDTLSDSRFAPATRLVILITDLQNRVLWEESALKKATNLNRQEITLAIKELRRSGIWKYNKETNRLETHVKGASNV